MSAAAPEKCDGLCKGLCEEDTFICDHIHGFVEWNAVQPPVDPASPLQVLINVCYDFDPGAGSQDVRDMPRFQLSDVALTIYKFINKINERYIDECKESHRTDLTIIKIYKYFQTDEARIIWFKHNPRAYPCCQASGEYCELSLETIKPGYETCYRIQKGECGDEAIIYNEEAYALSQLRTKLRAIIKDAACSDSERVAAIAAILDA
jgi:hypothetical protein